MQVDIQLLPTLPPKHLETPAFLDHHKKSPVSILGLRWSTQADELYQVTTLIIVAKSRVASLKHLTIRRLEL